MKASFSIVYLVIGTCFILVCCHVKVADEGSVEMQERARDFDLMAGHTAKL